MALGILNQFDQVAYLFGAQFLRRQKLRQPISPDRIFNLIEW